MKKIAWCISLAFLLMSVSLPSLTATITHNGYTLDTDTNIVTGNGLDWLQWDETVGQSIDQALATYGAVGWRLATNTEMAVLLNAFSFGLTFTAAETEQSIALPYNPSEGLASNNFIELFGQTNPDPTSSADPAEPQFRSDAFFGSDVDGDSFYNWAQIVDDHLFGGIPRDGEVKIWNDSFLTSNQGPIIGVALVRSTDDIDGDGLINTLDADADADGIPNTFEGSLNASDAFDAVLDLDTDGFSNLVEYRRGTDLNNASDTPAGIVNYHQKIFAQDGLPDDIFGIDVAIDGDYAVIGANQNNGAGNGQGKAYIFYNDNGVWKQQALLTASDGSAGDIFGSLVAISGDTVAISAFFDDHSVSGLTDAGSVYIYRRSGTSWTEEAILTAPDADNSDIFGRHLAIDGDRLIVGAPWNDDTGAESGAAYIFSRTGTTWDSGVKLSISDPAAGDQFGFHVALDGDTALVSALGKDVVYVYNFNGTSWDEQTGMGGRLLPSTGFSADFGIDIDIAGNIAVVGAPLETGASGSSTIYIFERASFGQPWSIANGTPVGNSGRFGEAVAIDAVTGLVSVGLRMPSGLGLNWIYQIEDFLGVPTWRRQDPALIPNDGISGDSFGYVNDINNGHVIVGAYLDDDLNPDAGMAFIFNLDHDNDNLNNYEEVELGTGVETPDSDGDGVLDGDEIALGADPLDTDSDDDGLDDGVEVSLGTGLTDNDSDDDGLNDGFEQMFGFNPLVGGEENLDPDNDMLSNLEEQSAGTDPTSIDTDGDGFYDGYEVANSTDPLTPEINSKAVPVAPLWALVLAAGLLGISYRRVRRKRPF